MARLVCAGRANSPRFGRVRAVGPGWLIVGIRGWQPRFSRRRRLVVGIRCRHQWLDRNHRLVVGVRQRTRQRGPHLVRGAHIKHLPIAEGPNHWPDSRPTHRATIC